MRDDRRQHTPLSRVFALLTGDEDARVCKEIPEQACRQQPGNYLRHLLSSLASKTADELASANLVIAWLLGAVGAPAALVGLLVPIREAGALLPQIAIAATLRRMPVRKWMWVAGSALQGASIGAMALAASTLSGAVAGWTIIALLVVFSLARGVCSVSHKDVLGKTIDRSRRGSVLGHAGAIAGIVTIAVGALLNVSSAPADGALLLMLLAAAAAWLVAAALFAALAEQPGATEGGGNAISEAVRSIGLLRSDRPFRQFVLTRALLLSTALSLPFYVSMAVERSGATAAGLGQFLLASGLASAISGPVWGRLADRSGRATLVAAPSIAALTGLALAALVAIDATWLDDARVHAALFLLVSVAHAGVRIGRKTYLVDLATPDTRASYVAVSNSLIGVLLLAGAAVGWVAQQFGTAPVILLLALVSLAAAASASRLADPQ